jgi:hypothetical protein
LVHFIHTCNTSLFSSSFSNPNLFLHLYLLLLYLSFHDRNYLINTIHSLVRSQVIKGAVPVKRSKEERRQLAAAKGSREAAQLVSTAEATPEDLENDRLMSEADLEDSDADSDLEVEGEGEGGDGSSSNTKAKRQGEVSSSALANMEIGEGDHDEFTEVRITVPHFVGELFEVDLFLVVFFFTNSMSILHSPRSYPLS